MKNIRIKEQKFSKPKQKSEEKPLRIKEVSDQGGSDQRGWIVVIKITTVTFCNPFLSQIKNKSFMESVVASCEKIVGFFVALKNQKSQEFFFFEVVKGHSKKIFEWLYLKQSFFK
eukprot:TRINITY_DN4148_c0_g1_i3.p13 TRINITY_DN4148_c0_g1~~TRINITY_DN4148_c0_g1_i3.p13  ORF type:complete len:115 (+),score=11.68 TRINITY_DN4148_c0_g1_i3:3299-3643(+)